MGCSDQPPDRYCFSRCLGAPYRRLTITNTFTDQVDDIVQIMHTTVVGITSEDVNAGISDKIATPVRFGIPDVRAFCRPETDSLPTSSDAVTCPNFSDPASRSRSS